MAHQRIATLVTSIALASLGCGGDDSSPAGTADTGVAVDSSVTDTATPDTAVDTTIADTAVADVATDATTDAPVTLLCGTCHAQYVAKLEAGKHKSLTNRCLDCHKDAVAHQADPAKVKVAIDFSLDMCAGCHADQKTQFLKDDTTYPGKYGGSTKVSKYIQFPKYQHLMGGHGFTKEYNEERAHAYALKDHVDIARKQNTACLQCKSTPVTYFWGESRRGVSMFGKDITWADAVTKIKADYGSTIDHGTSCTHCHDAHTTRFRLIRKQMINAVLERGTDPYEPAFNFVPKTYAELEDKLNERGTDGALTANAKRLAGTLTCAQCHVEYTCGPGVDVTVLRDDFPWRKLRDIEAYYKVKYDTKQDWKHSGTGLNGIKAQHPETEFFWESKHYKAGATCRDCHMGFVADGKPRSHWFTSSLKQVPATCGKCHGSAAADYVKKVTDSQDLIMAKATAAENALDAVLTRIEACTAGTATCDAAKLPTAKEAFMKGLLWWEFTVVSENSAGWHNPEEANTNLDTAQAQADLAKTLLGM